MCILIICTEKSCIAIYNTQYMWQLKMKKLIGSYTKQYQHYQSFYGRKCVSNHTIECTHYSDLTYQWITKVHDLQIPSH